MSDFGWAYHRAQKEYECGFCRQSIPKGVIYWRWRGIVDGRFEAMKMHDGCQQRHEEAWAYIDEMDKYFGVYDSTDAKEVWNGTDMAEGE